MKKFFIYIMIIAIFFILGRVIANSNKSFFKNKYGNRIANNFYGNIIAIIGFIFICAINFGITNFLFFSISSIALLFSYFLHVMDYTGENFDGALKLIINNDKKLIFQKKMISMILALLVSGAISTTIAPILIKENKTTVENAPNIDMNTSIEEHEENFDDYFY